MRTKLNYIKQLNVKQPIKNVPHPSPSSLHHISISPSRGTPSSSTSTPNGDRSSLESYAPDRNYLCLHSSLKTKALYIYTTAPILRSDKGLTLALSFFSGRLCTRKRPTPELVTISRSFFPRPPELRNGCIAAQWFIVTM